MSWSTNWTLHSGCGREAAPTPVSFVKGFDVVVEGTVFRVDKTFQAAMVGSFQYFRVDGCAFPPRPVDDSGSWANPNQKTQRLQLRDQLATFTNIFASQPPVDKKAVRDIAILRTSRLKRGRQRVDMHTPRSHQLGRRTPLDVRNVLIPDLSASGNGQPAPREPIVVRAPGQYPP